MSNGYEPFALQVRNIMHFLLAIKILVKLFEHFNRELNSSR